MATPDAPATETAVDPFRSLSALRAAHTELLIAFHTLDEDHLPADFVAAVQTFLARGQASGLLFDVDEDRADAQTLLNYWTAVLYNAGVTARPTLLSDFDAASAHSLVGDISPYVGLGTFQERDSPIFFGRRKLLQQMVGTLQQSRFLAVVGLSGSGKSSLVRAGLLPQIRTGGVQGSGGWRVLEPMVPGPDPIGNLAVVTKPPDMTLDVWRHLIAANDDTFVRTLGEPPAVLVVDQLEELFTLADEENRSDREARATFAAQIVRLVRQGDVRHTVVVTLRSDFEDALARYPELQALFDPTYVFRVPPLDPIGLRNAIERPAARQGVTFEKGLVAELMEQVLGEPAGLPLLQFSLLKLWEGREGARITWQKYRELGNSVRAILAESARRTYESFLEEDRAIVKALFRRLAVVGLGGEVTSKRVTRSTLDVENAAPDRVNRVVTTLVEAGLLRITPGTTPATDQFEVTHEALLRNWPMLSDWFGEERERQRKRLQLAAAADWWSAHGEDPSGLLSGLRLEEAKEYRDLTPLEQRFVETSHDATTSKQRRLWAAAMIVLTAASLLLAFAGYQTWELRHATESVTTAQRAAAEAQKQKEEIDRKTLEARTQFDTVLAEVAKAVHGRDLAKAELDEINGQLGKVRQDLQASEAATAKAQTVAEQRKVELQAATEQLGQRPWLRLAEGRLDPPRQWSALGKYADQIFAAASSVARVQVASARGAGTFHSGFLVAKDLLATFWTPSMGSPSEASIIAEFTQPSGAGSEPLRVRSANMMAYDDRTNVAVFRLTAVPGLERLRPLQIDRRRGPAVGDAVYVIGHGVNRGLGALPGYIVSMTSGDGFFNHDCQTIPGSSGAPIIDLASGIVVGLHWGATGGTVAGGPGVKRGVRSDIVADLRDMPLLRGGKRE